MDIGKNIRRLRKQRGMSQEELARELDVSRAAVTQWETGWSKPRMGTIERLSAFFGVSKSEIIDGPSAALPANASPVYSSGEATVPLLTLGRVHAGSLTDEEEAEHRVEVPAGVLENHPRAFALTVEGVVETEGYRAVMRRWYRGSSTLMLTADSYGEQEDMVFSFDDGPVRVVGTVVWYQAPGEME